MFCIISYATKDTPYEDILNKYLLSSLLSLQGKKVGSYIEKIENKGDWYANTSYKPTFILNAIRKCESAYDSVVFLDADAKVLKYPQLFEDIPEEYDIALHHLSWEIWYGYKGDNTKELLSGTVFFRINDKVKNLIKDWANEAEKSREWEQKVLAKVLLRHPEIKVYPLPIEYIYINSLPDDRPPLVKCDPVIVHYQLSRELKRLKKVSKYKK